MTQIKLIRKSENADKTGFLNWISFEGFTNGFILQHGLKKSKKYLKLILKGFATQIEEIEEILKIKRLKD